MPRDPTAQASQGRAAQCPRIASTSISTTATCLPLVATVGYPPSPTTFRLAAKSQRVRPRRRIMKHIGGGWTLSGILLFQTGPFFTAITGGNTDPSGTNVNVRANDRPDYTGTSYGN